MRQEKRIAKQIGGRTQPGSGNQWHSKGDVVDKHIMVECKTTENRSYSIKADDFEKLMDQALSKAKDPVMQIDMPNLSLAVIPWSNYMVMLEDFKLVMSQKERIETLEKALKVVIHEMFKREAIEHSDDVYPIISKHLAKGEIPEIDLKV